jgi:isocitrate dehydrogenase
MTRVLWRMLKDELLSPFVALNAEYYDLGLENRDRTGDEVTTDAANAIKRHRVGVKCATITPNRQRVEEYKLKEMWKSPNATIRALLDGTVFRAPIVLKRVPPSVRDWSAPITIARHAYGDVYKAAEYRVPGKGRAELLFTGEDGTAFRETIYDFECPGVLQAMHNKDSSIVSFAHSCFRYALSTGQDLWFSTKDTISKQYDQTFKLIFQEIYERDYAEAFKARGIEYFYTLIDDAVARVIRSKGGFIWALKNYDGDVMSDMISRAFGSLAMMTSVLVSPDGNYEYEAAHGTVTRHYYRYQRGEAVSTNPIATLFAWTGALAKRGELDGNAPLTAFAKALEKASIDVMEEGTMPKELAILCEDTNPTPVNTAEFIAAIRARIERDWVG